MSEPFVGEIRMFAGNFAPRGWAFCDGQLLAVSQNDALFSLLGTIYGGGRPHHVRVAGYARQTSDRRWNRPRAVTKKARLEEWI